MQVHPDNAELINRAKSKDLTNLRPSAIFRRLIHGSPKGVGYRTADYTTVLELVTFRGQFSLILFHEMAHALIRRNTSACQ